MKIGVLGLGFMGQTHIRAYDAARSQGFPCELAAVCDRDPDRLRGDASTGGNLGDEAPERLFDPDTLVATDDLDAFLALDLDLVSICTHTDTHVEVARRAIEAGRHVLVEKPLATTSAEARSLASLKTDRVVMPAMCIRFWPAYVWLKEQLDSGAFGRCRSATFHRLASPPAWAPDFYRDATRTGGALVDLHIHDADFIRFAFGDPAGVKSTGTIDHVTTLYEYDHVDHVVAEGGWDHAPGHPFQMRYLVNFEDATADFDVGRDHPLLLHRGGESEPVDLPTHTGYDAEVLACMTAITNGDPSPVPVEDAVAVLELLERERASFES